MIYAWEGTKQTKKVIFKEWIPGSEAGGIKMERIAEKNKQPVVFVVVVAVVE